MKQFVKIMDELSYRWHRQQVFDDFLMMAVCAFARGTMEEIYEERAKRYDDRERQLFGKALGALVTSYEEASDTAGSWTDVLGQYFEEVNSSATASHNGQFFTPVHLCDMMARLIEDKEDDTVPEMVNDPSCGSSRNLIAHARMCPDNRLLTTYVGQDLDQRCVLMSVINFVMYGMKGYIIHSDTLKMEFYGGYRIFLPETGMMVRRLSADQAKSIVTRTVEREPVKVMDKPVREVKTQSAECRAQSAEQPKAGKHGQLQLF